MALDQLHSRLYISVDTASILHNKAVLERNFFPNFVTTYINELL